MQLFLRRQRSRWFEYFSRSAEDFESPTTDEQLLYTISVTTSLGSRRRTILWITRSRESKSTTTKSLITRFSKFQCHHESPTTKVHWVASHFHILTLKWPSGHWPKGRWRPALLLHQCAMLARNRFQWGQYLSAIHDSSSTAWSFWNKFAITISCHVRISSVFTFEKVLLRNSFAN